MTFPRWLLWMPRISVVYPLPDHPPHTYPQMPILIPQYPPFRFRQHHHEGPRHSCHISAKRFRILLLQHFLLSAPDSSLPFAALSLNAFTGSYTTLPSAPLLRAVQQQSLVRYWQSGASTLTNEAKMEEVAYSPLVSFLMSEPLQFAASWSVPSRSMPSQSVPSRSVASRSMPSRLAL